MKLPEVYANTSLIRILQKYTQLVRRYTVLGFIVLIAGLYGFLMLRITTLSNTQPTDDAISSQVQVNKLPRIDPKVVEQLQSLRDNSVSVQALFEQARSNPFQ